MKFYAFHARFLNIIFPPSGSNIIPENGLDGAKREHLMPDLCVICLEQEYNAAFVP